MYFHRKKSTPEVLTLSSTAKTLIVCDSNILTIIFSKTAKYLIILPSITIILIIFNLKKCGNSFDNFFTQKNLLDNFRNKKYQKKKNAKQPKGSN